jgi:hypothetical protein
MKVGHKDTEGKEDRREGWMLGVDGNRADTDACLHAGCIACMDYPGMKPLSRHGRLMDIFRALLCFGFLLVWSSAMRADPPAGVDKAPKGAAHCYVLWPASHIIGSVGIYVDGKKVGKVSRNRMVSFEVAPGDHVISVKSASALRPFSPSAKMQVHLASGESVYLKFRFYNEVKGAMMYGNTPVVESENVVSLEVVSASEVQQLRQYRHIVN